MPLGAHLAQLSRRLEEHLALTPEAASWAIESWAVALGVLPAGGRLPDHALRLAGGEQPRIAAPGGHHGVRSVLAWMVGVAALWALVGGSAAALAATIVGAGARQGNWVASGILAGAALGALAGALVRTVGGTAGDLVGWAVGGTIGGATLGAFVGAAAGSVAGVALEGPAVAASRAAQWAAVGATVGGLISTVLGVLGRRPSLGASVAGRDERRGAASESAGA
jgi:hypothetical protein